MSSSFKEEQPEECLHFSLRTVIFIYHLQEELQENLTPPFFQNICLLISYSPKERTVNTDLFISLSEH